MAGQKKKITIYVVLAVASFFIGRKSVSYTHVPEFTMRVIAPPAFESVALCFGCKFEPWQRVFIGGTMANNGNWKMHDITVVENLDGMGGDIGGTCPNKNRCAHCPAEGRAIR